MLCCGCRSFRFVSRAALKRLAILLVTLVLALCWCWWAMIRMPGTSYSGPLPPLSQSQSALSAQLHRDVDFLATTIGQRNVRYPDGLSRAVEFLDRSLREMGYAVQRQEFNSFGTSVCNLEVEVAGVNKPDEIVVIGAHYDSVDDSPAANDNGSGAAATLALARMFAPSAAGRDGGPSALRAAAPDRTIRFVLFVNEEPPFFKTADMGSLVYARRCAERGEKIVGMLSLETIGCYSDQPGSQQYPVKPIGWLYPDRGNFIAFVGNYRSRALVRQAIGSFRTSAQFPSEGAALPGWITGVDWSDHWSFWQAGYPALMITDTALFRYPHYHQDTDTADRLEYDRMARVVEGLKAVTDDLARVNVWNK